jgi:hypothetical protein
MRDSFHNCVEIEMLFDRHPLEDAVVLGAVTDLSPHFLKVKLTVHAVDSHQASGRGAFIRETLKGRGFARAVNSQHSETFTVVQSERGLLNGDYWFTHYAWIDLSEIFDPDPDFNRITVRYPLLFLLHILIPYLYLHTWLYLILRQHLHHSLLYTTHEPTLNHKQHDRPRYEVYPQEH